MPVQKRSISLDAEVAAAIEKVAAEEGTTVSAWLGRMLAGAEDASAQNAELDAVANEPAPRGSVSDAA